MTLDESQADVTGLLLDWRRGNQDAFDRLVPLVYHELHAMAHAKLRSEPPGQVLQTTAVVDEVFVRLIDLERITFESRAHFFALAARLMRQILVDQARRRRSDKRGGNVTLVSFDDRTVGAQPERSIDVLALDEALGELDRLSERPTRVVELRFFAGLSIEETAAALEVSTATVERDWAFAKAWLYQRLS
jgi:RNA polymerase sigma factor (TIGR02999 family)